jgi:hypothetical protein
MLVLTPPPVITSFWIHGVFLRESTSLPDSLLSTCYVARRWLLESMNEIDDFTARSKNIVGRALAHSTRLTDSTARPDNPIMPSPYDHTPSPSTSLRATRTSAWTFPHHVWRWVCNIISLHTSVNSDRTAPHYLAQPLTPALRPF